MRYETLKPFTISGSILETALVEEKYRLEGELSKLLRDSGYIDVLDLDPDWSLWYDQEEVSYRFSLVMYGVECDRPWDYAGILGGKKIPKSTASSK